MAKGRAGDVKTLHAWCTANGIECYVMPAVKAMDVRFSSSLVREALQSGDVVTAAAILAAPIESRGGWRMATSWAARSASHHQPAAVGAAAAFGVYAVRVYGVDVAGVQAVTGAASVGCGQP